ncbi:MAG: hypothetical protein HPY55_03185 [Firmicutes bacterium]|nr:hypothetical protein [Bacillota bacterium]
MNLENSGRRNVRDLQASLAGYFLQLGEGKRLPSIRELSSSTQMSVGAISTALRGLQDMGAVDIQRRGHMGSYLTRISVSRLWNLLGQGPLVIALTLPMHRRFEGLATGLKIGFEKAGMEAYLIFIRGSRTRLKALHDNRCHAVVMSGLAAGELTGQENEVLLSLPPTTWLSGYSVFYRNQPPEPGRPLRVAVDPQSHDHCMLTDLEFAGQDVETRSVSFIQISQLLKRGEIDAIVWNTEQVEDFLGPGISYRPLADRVMALAGQKSVSAVFVGRKGDYVVRAVLRACIDPVEIMEIQKKVVDGEMIPEY